MKLLIVTQAVDTDNPTLGFFVSWIKAFAKRIEHTEVICLQMGRNDLAPSTALHSLGKERGPRTSIVYALRFLCLAWALRDRYDTVFVHMNQEYVLLAGWLWKILGKKVYLWRNHWEGSWLTDLAALFCEHVFYTSKHSYTARYRKALQMPVGVDTERFKLDGEQSAPARSILFLARMAPSKRPEMLIDALSILAEKGEMFSALFVGSPSPRDASYLVSLKERVRARELLDRVHFEGAVPNRDTPNLYQAHAFFINTSPSGMLDKTLFEAAACGALPLAASADWKELTVPELHFSDAEELAERFTHLTHLTPHEQTEKKHMLAQLVAAHSLTRLMDRLERVL